MRKIDPNVAAHLEWLGFVQPTGLVVSASALVRNGAILPRRDAEGQRSLDQCVEYKAFPGESGPAPWLPNFREFAQRVLGWTFSSKGYAGTEDRPIPDELKVHLEDYGVTLRPDFAVIDRYKSKERPVWQLLVKVIEADQPFDRVTRTGANGYEASPHQRMERLLRSTGVPGGLLFNGRALRLISAPPGETSGWLDFRVDDMLQTAGHPILAAMRLLLHQRRLLAVPEREYLAALLEGSRRYQNEVSERLAEQVLHALYEFLRGFQAAHDASQGRLLRRLLEDDPDEIYRGLLTVVLRLVFLFYAEERNMLPGHGTFLQYYSVLGLYERLREEAALYPDTMDQRFGAWAQLLALFRMVYDGAECGDFRLPRRHGALFDPDRFPFLEGRTDDVGPRQVHTRIEAPQVPDGTIYRVLDKLLVLDGERISYRALDVEQIGSVYETMMGFRLEVASGRSIAIRSKDKYGASVVIDLDALLEQPPGNRAKWISDQTGRRLSASTNAALRQATTVEDLHAALQNVIDKAATPDIVPRGAMVFQPSDERRRSGSHYTPREMTEPIVRKALAPVLERLRGEDGKPPPPGQLLELKVCDPAMGSGAFLVEACRHLGDALVEAWHVYGGRPEIGPDEDEVIVARRLVAQRCLYGVDRNPVAVDLAKVSLWLATLSKDQPLTFLDHALRHGDALVGLSRRQIEWFHWDPDALGKQSSFGAMKVRRKLQEATELRRQIRDADHSVSDWELRELWEQAEAALDELRLSGDLLVAAFFSGEKKSIREEKRLEFAGAIVGGEAERYREWLMEQRAGERPLVPFHWEIEFPEVFDRENPGFDVFVGNPPFAGKNAVAAANREGYLDWLKLIHEGAHGNSDIVAHFFRRAFSLLRHGGTFGLIATNTIAQGDTRATGLRWICTNGGTIFAARRRVRWPGEASVVVSVVHVMKGEFKGIRELDGRKAEAITAFLFHRGGHEDPARLAENTGKSFQGSIILGMGFTFDDTDTRGVASSLAEMEKLIKKDPRNAERIFPYIGGEEVNNSPTQAHHRFVINFFDMTEEQAREWPDLWSIVERRVKPERVRQRRKALRERWWQYEKRRPGLYRAVEGLERVLVVAQTSSTLAFAFQPNGRVWGHTLIVFPESSTAFFAILQSRVHRVWVEMFAARMKDDLRYIPSDCFDTFPFPRGWEVNADLEEIGRMYYDFRAGLMVRKNEGLTATYNRFHDPDEDDTDVLRLRELHAEMDRIVLDAYGWTDIPTEYEFLLDYEIDGEAQHNRRKPWQLRWPDDIRDEVLARLMELNTQRAAEEQLSGARAVGASRRPGRRDSQRSMLPGQGGFVS